MRNWNLRAIIICVGCFMLMPSAMRGQVSDEEKKRLFLQAREQIEPVSKPTPSPTPRPKPKAASSPKSSGKSKSKSQEGSRKSAPKPDAPAPKKVPEKDEEPSEDETAKAEPPPKEEPRKSESDDYILIPEDKSSPAHAKPSAASTPVVKEKETSAPFQPQIPKSKTPSGQPLEAPIQIEKSGLQEDAGLEPPPTSPFGGFMKRYRYLTPSVRKAIDGAKVQRGRWKYIVVHNSGTRQGNARIFDLYHRNVRKMQNGLAYHFVIGNGNSSGDGQIEIGNRWTRQINGGHVASDYLNDISLGICLVGDLNRDLPTKDQLGALDELCTYLRDRVGKIKGRPAIVKGHKEINPKPTDCPGDRFPLGWLRKRFGG